MNTETTRVFVWRLFAFVYPVDVFRNPIQTFTVEAIRANIKVVWTSDHSYGSRLVSSLLPHPSGFGYVFASTSLSRYSLPAVSQKRTRGVRRLLLEISQSARSFLHLTELRYIFQTYVKLPKTPTVLSIAGVLRRTRPVAIGNVMWLT